MTERLSLPTESDEYVDQCHYSHNGWAIWKRDPSGEEHRNWCTCRPARKPKCVSVGETAPVKEG